MLRQYFSTFQKEHMSVDEKNQIRKHLYTTVKKSAIIPHTKQYIFNSLVIQRLMFVSLIIATMLALSGTASYAAENTVPGDVLYPVKVHVNEVVRDIVTVGDEAEADWSAQKAERRLKEVATLETRGELDSNTEAELAQKIEKQLNLANDFILKLEVKNKLPEASRISSRVHAVLRAHTDSMNTDTEMNTNTTTPASDDSDNNTEQKLGMRIRNIISQGLKDRESFEASAVEHIRNNIKNTREEAVNGIKTATENKLREVTGFVEHTLGDLPDEAQVRARAMLAEIVHVKSEADEKLANGEYADAFEKYQKIIRLAQEVKIKIQTYFRLETKQQHKKDGKNTVTTTNEAVITGNETKTEPVVKTMNEVPKNTQKTMIQAKTKARTTAPSDDDTLDSEDEDWDTEDIEEPGDDVTDDTAYDSEDENWNSDDENVSNTNNTSDDELLDSEDPNWSTENIEPPSDESADTVDNSTSDTSNEYTNYTAEELEYLNSEEYKKSLEM